MISPCECGEPLNSVARDLLPERFDPLNIDNTSKKKAVSVMILTIILCLAFTESVSVFGRYINLNTDD